MAFAEFDVENVKFAKVKPKEYKSSKKVTRTFCQHCGSPIEWRSTDVPDKTSITLGLLDTKNNFGEIDDLYEEESPNWK